MNPLLFISEDKEKALSAGCDDFDTKPVEFKRLRNLIDNIFVKSPSIIWCANYWKIKF